MSLEQLQLPPTSREKLFKELEKLAKEILIKRRELMNTITQVKRLLWNRTYDSTNVLLHLLGQLTNEIM